MSGKEGAVKNVERRRNLQKTNPHVVESKDGEGGEATRASAGSVSSDSTKPCTQEDLIAVSNKITDKIVAVLDMKITEVSNKLDTINAKLDAESLRLDAAEQRIAVTEESVEELETRLANAEKKLALMAGRLDDQEARGRRDNLRIYGVKEGFEKGNALSFFETWLPKLLNFDAPKGRLVLDRCHRTGGAGHFGSDTPRPVIMKLHYPADKMRVLSLCAGRKLTWEGATITIRQDFPQNIVQQRRAFNTVCQKLIAKNIRFRMKYPAILAFSLNKKEYSFDSAAAAGAIVDTMEQEASCE
uniref:Uncharacterized protein n=1 Tax=Knipowitschia caucasica TaxID=637954 RepID=A0AAV2LVX3_KNICA